MLLLQALLATLFLQTVHSEPKKISKIKPSLPRRYDYIRTADKKYFVTKVKVEDLLHFDLQPTVDPGIDPNNFVEKFCLGIKIEEVHAAEMFPASSTNRDAIGDFEILEPKLPYCNGGGIHQASKFVVKMKALASANGKTYMLRPTIIEKPTEQQHHYDYERMESEMKQAAIDGGDRKYPSEISQLIPIFISVTMREEHPTSPPPKFEFDTNSDEHLSTSSTSN